jgi:RimJ/RimL family protein N-acetyltransferase
MAGKEIACRILTPDDAKAYRDIRLEALFGDDAKDFRADREEERAYSIAQWQEVCTETCDHAAFGAFVDGELAGIMLATKWPRDEQAVRWHAAYITPAFRGGKVKKDLFGLCEDWSVKHGFKRAVFAIFDGNERSKNAFRDDRTKLMESTPDFPNPRKGVVCADGSTRDGCWYEKSLAPGLK